MAILYRTNDTHEEVSPASGRAFTLAELQALIGGHIELVPVDPSIPAHILPVTDGFLIVNEDGRGKGLPFNTSASVLAGQDIVGDALLVPPSEME